MTRLPGTELGQVYEELSDKDKDASFLQMQLILRTMRKWSRPRDRDRICSVSGTSIRSVRVPNHLIPPCDNEQELNEYLISVASGHAFSSQDQYEDKLVRAKRIQAMPHRVMFTHGDLKHHNILFHKGHISGFVDWESAGWYPEYWEFTTALRFCRKNFWWYDFVSRLGGSEYMEEGECERALTALTVDSYAW
ncbi:MAG: hypothetical protein Q9160_009226 [Pyrenula sp. 1 TL-2023]